MVKVAAHGYLPSNSLQFGGGAASKTTTAVKRKTPSELRGEQLKRRNVLDLINESSITTLDSERNANGSISGLKKSDTSNNPRYIDTCMDELVPVRKSSTRLRLLCKKEIAKSRRFTCFNSSY
jgi:hypothetical protein